MRERRVPEPEVALVLTEPDEIDYGPDGELIARKHIGRREVFVVFTEFHDTRRIITVMTS